MERPTDDPTDDPRVQRRVVVLAHLRDGAIDLDVAATVLGVSTRQVRRLLATWLEHRPAGLVHGNHGREPANRTDAEVRTRIEKLTTST